MGDGVHCDFNAWCVLPPKHTQPCARGTGDLRTVDNPVDDGDNPEMVHHPAHYGGESDPFETIKVIEARGFNFNLGSAYRYIDRAGKKDPRKYAEDLEKAVFYIQREIKHHRGKL